MNKLIIENLNDLKFTKISNVIHFKYKNENYFIYNSDDRCKLYKGRKKGKDNECISSQYGEIDNLIRYNYNRNTLSSIDKENFVAKLYNNKLIDTTIVEIKNRVDLIQDTCAGLYSAKSKIENVLALLKEKL